MLVALLVGSPDVPVHAVTVRYTPHGRRTHVRVRVSERLPVDARTMTGPQMTDIIRDRMLTLGELDYCDQYAVVVKAKARREREARAAGRPDVAPTARAGLTAVVVRRRAGVGCTHNSIARGARRNAGLRGWPTATDPRT